MDIDQKHSCPSCGKWTTEGLQAWKVNNRSHPIFLKPEDFKRPMSEVIEELRCQLSTIRGKISDIRMGGLWDEELKDAEGLLTCGISYLYHVRSQMLDHKHKYPEESPG